MSKSLRMAGDTKPRLRLVGAATAVAEADSPGPGRRMRWLINGYPAVLTLWTDQEWDRLEIRPSDARRVDGGFWCVLRME